MDPERVKKQNGKVFNTNQVELIKNYYIDSNYELKPYSNNKIGPTGRLEIGAIIPRDNTLAKFILRWDENQDLFDIEIENVDSKTKQDFIEEQNGCTGHHPEKVSEKNGRIIKANINLMNKRIFEGDIKVSVARKLEFNETITLEAQCDVKYTKKEDRKDA